MFGYIKHFKMQDHFFQRGRGKLLVNCVQEETKLEPDLHLVSSQGDIVPVHR